MFLIFSHVFSHLFPLKMARISLGKALLPAPRPPPRRARRCPRAPRCPRRRDRGRPRRPRNRPRNRPWAKSPWPRCGAQEPRQEPMAIEIRCFLAKRWWFFQLCQITRGYIMWLLWWWIYIGIYIYIGIGIIFLGHMIWNYESYIADNLQFQDIGVMRLKKRSNAFLWI